jgi:hypothetical protein
MLSCTVAAVLFGVTLPSPGDIPTLAAGESAELRTVDGEAWFRILEDDFVCLSVSVPGASEVTAYDNSGEAVCTGSREGGMVLSAFSDYWFYVCAVPADGARGVLTASVEEETAGNLPAGDRVSSAVARNEMAETFMFEVPSSGRWTIALEGGGGTDLDLEVYGNRMSSWGSSMSLGVDERVTVPLMPGDTVTVVVSRFNKAGDGSYALRALRSGDFPVLSVGSAGHAIGFDSIERFIIPGRRAPGFLSLAIGDPDADIDITVHDTEGDYIMGAQSYSPVEALMLPESADTLVADIVLFDAPSEEPVPYTLSLQQADGSPGPAPVRRSIALGGPVPAQPVGFMPEREGFFRVSAVFEKLRDGDVLVFRESGEPVLTHSTGRGDEEFLLWAEPGERVYVLPCFQTFGTAGSVEMTIEEVQPAMATGTVTGEVAERSPASFFVADAPAGSILYVGLTGIDGETDLDLYLSGPGVDLVAEGGASNVDAAGNEAVTVYAWEDSRYGITVYMYDRTGGTPFNLSVQAIQSPPLAASSPSSEIWAMTAGISGYPDAADVLNRASMDAMEFYRFLTDGLGVSEDHVIVLVDAMATEDAFRDGLGSLLEVAGAEDRVLVFFSGHGSQMNPGSGGSEESDSANETICLYDGDLEDDWLAGEIEDEARAPVVVMLDACHSGGFVNDFGMGSNTLVLTAAREDLSVSERVLTPILLGGAKGAADTDGDDRISAVELMRYIDGRLLLICPECDAVLETGDYVCPECGAALKGDNAVPRPEQGMFLDNEGMILWPVVGSGWLGPE